MKNLKYILIFLLLIIISTAGYAGWDYYNTKKIEEERVEQEEQWKIYENEEFNFSIEYPKNLMVEFLTEDELIQGSEMVTVVGKLSFYEVSETYNKRINRFNLLIVREELEKIVSIKENALNFTSKEVLQDRKDFEVVKMIYGQKILDTEYLVKRKELVYDFIDVNIDNKVFEKIYRSFEFID